MMNDAAVAATAHANPYARFARIEFKAHPHFIASSDAHMCQCTLHFGPAEVPGVGLFGSLSLHISWQRGRKEFMSCIVSQENTENSPAEFVLADRRLGSTVGPGVDAKIGVTLRRRRLKIQNRIGCPHTVFPTPLNDTTTRIFRLCLASCRSLNSPSAGRDVARTDQNRDRCKTMRVPSRRN
jgi:hypothetical protein